MAREKQWPPRVYVHKPSGRDRVRINGKDIWLGPTGSAQAKLAYAELIVRLEKDRQGKPQAPPARKGLTVAEVVERWDAHAQARYTVEGREAEQHRMACEPLLAVHASTRADSFGASQLEEVQDEMVRRGLSRRVINRRIVRIRTLWRWAERKGLAPAGSWSALRALEPLAPNDPRVKDPPRRQPCTWATVVRVYRQCAPVPRDMLLVQWYTGCRSGEVRLLRVCDLERTGSLWAWRPPRHKNSWRGHERLILVGPRAQALLRRHLEGKGPGDLVFPSAPGQAYTDESYPRAVARACVRAGVTGLTPYSCRHAYKQRATRELGLDHARAALGQASLDSTDRYASGQDRRLAEDVARRLG